MFYNSTLVQMITYKNVFGIICVVLYTLTTIYKYIYIYIYILKYILLFLEINIFLTMQYELKF